MSPYSSCLDYSHISNLSIWLNYMWGWPAYRGLDSYKGWSPIGLTQTYFIVWVTCTIKLQILFKSHPTPTPPLELAHFVGITIVMWIFLCVSHKTFKSMIGSSNGDWYFGKICHTQLFTILKYISTFLLAIIKYHYVGMVLSNENNSLNICDPTKITLLFASKGKECTDCSSLVWLFPKSRIRELFRQMFVFCHGWSVVLCKGNGMLCKLLMFNSRVKKYMFLSTNYIAKWFWTHLTANNRLLKQRYNVI